MLLSSIHSFASIAQIAQIPLVLFISILCYRSIKMLGLREFLWVSCAFMFNLLHIIFILISDDKSPFFPLFNINVKKYHDASICLDLVTAFLFFLSFIQWFTHKEVSKNFKTDSRFNLVKILKAIWGSRVRAIIQLILISVFVLSISISKDFNMKDSVMNWTSTLYSLFALFHVTLLFKMNSAKYDATNYLTVGFVLWGLLQLLLPLQDVIGEGYTLVLGFTFSLIAKLCILTGIFLWCVDFTGDSQGKIERDRSEKEHFHKSSIAFKEILSRTFHEINSPLKDLGTSIDTLSKNIPRLFRSLMKPLENNYERVKAIIIVSKHSYDQEGNYTEDDIDFDKEKAKDEIIVNINTLIEASMRSTKNFFKPLHIEFITDYSSKCFIECVQSQIMQLFNNLFKNSVEAYDEIESKKIMIKTYIDRDVDNDKPSLVVVEIEDYGTGILPEIQELVWEAEFSTKKRNKNVTIRGQGLAVAKKIISEHKGSTISMESPIKKGDENVVRGTKFIIRFPKYELKK